MVPIDLLSCLVFDELTRRADRLLERRRKRAGFRDPDRALENFDFTFNPKMNRSLVFERDGCCCGLFADPQHRRPPTNRDKLASAVGNKVKQFSTGR